MLYEFRGKCKKEHPPAKCAEEIFMSVHRNTDCKLTKQEFIEGTLYRTKQKKNLNIDLKKQTSLFLF